MARKYDIIERLKAKNERPFVVVDKDHSYTINTSKTNVMAIMAMLDKEENSFESDMKMFDVIIGMALGQEALEYISSQDYTMAVYECIIDVIMAGISDKELQEVKQEKK